MFKTGGAGPGPRRRPWLQHPHLQWRDGGEGGRAQQEGNGDDYASLAGDQEPERS
ncbi:hypothetical protein ACRAWD_24210 [Caulobacter segnis]